MRRSHEFKTTIAVAVIIIADLIKDCEVILPDAEKGHFGVVANIISLPERVNEFRSQLNNLIRLTRNEDGCVSCELIENNNDSTKYTLIIEWLNEKAHTAHFSTIMIRDTLRILSKLTSDDLGFRDRLTRLNTIAYGANCYFQARC